MNLKSAVEKYLEATGEFGRPMPLAQFGLSREETEAMLAAWEEDYHLHRHFELQPPAGGGSGEEPGAAYNVQGLACAAIVFHESILHALE